MIRQKGYPCEADFAEQVTLTLLLPAEESEALITAITEKTDGGAKIQPLGKSLEEYRPTN